MIPKIIHQVWEEKIEPLPEFLNKLSETWKENHPQWQYEFWDCERMDHLVQNYYPDLAATYYGYRYPVQRWDSIRYMILHFMGGLYVDFDYNCIEPIDELLLGKSCCLGMDPEENAELHKKLFIVTNSFMACEPEHPFMKFIIDQLPVAKTGAKDKHNYVLETTGAFFVTDLYNRYQEKENITLFSPELTSPLTKHEIEMLFQGEIDEDFIEKKLEKAVAVHYFSGMW